MARMNDIDSMALRGLLNTLPPELYNEIYNLTFTAERKIHLLSQNTGGTEENHQELVQEHSFTTLNTRLPQLFHVDRASRAQFADSYFATSGSIFVLYPAPRREKELYPFSRILFRRISTMYLPFRPYSGTLTEYSSRKLSPRGEEGSRSIEGRIVVCGKQDVVKLIEEHADASKA
ncbi:hypothetical protein CKM354_000442600 [Cercospora kikuchii]|uniref:Uncharacterized protein n=1 Tax=Cercospora kikuchii TaxID=84275 RepID=A0A9P3CJV5_9PEZI|nr:uncharacterized protein CKM354_000442600 [Cercospora kikuchii]GIZ41110.1 hypothetical protein CKM354_000442600 [Cercospora kikuchii]